MKTYTNEIIAIVYQLERRVQELETIVNSVKALEFTAKDFQINGPGGRAAQAAQRANDILTQYLTLNGELEDVK